MNRIILLSLALTCTGVTPAFAGNFFGALDLGQARAKNICDSAASAGIRDCKDTSTASRFGGGYQFNPMWGAEVSYAQYGHAELGQDRGNWKMKGVHLSGTAACPLSNSLALTAKLGVSRLNFETTTALGSSFSKTNIKPAFGLGVRYALTKKIAVRAQYERLGEVGDARTGTAQIKLISLGAMVGW